jgi:site-specific DNA recombinase
MHVAYYARVSTNQQQHEGTIESQRGVRKHHILQQNWTLLPEHEYSDDGISGARLDRPALDRLRDAARRGSSMPSSSCRPIGLPGTMHINGS